MTHQRRRPGPAVNVMRCAWCTTWLDGPNGEPLFDLFTMSGVFVAVCYESCPAPMTVKPLGATIATGKAAA